MWFSHNNPCVLLSEIFVFIVTGAVNHCYIIKYVYYWEVHMFIIYHRLLLAYQGQWIIVTKSSMFITRKSICLLLHTDQPWCVIHVMVNQTNFINHTIYFEIKTLSLHYHYNYVVFILTIINEELNFIGMLFNKFYLCIMRWLTKAIF